MSTSLRAIVAASDGNRVCRTCVNPDTARRCNEFPGCSSANNSVCAQDFCISRCSIDPPDFDQLRDDLADLRYQLDPSGTPNCPACRVMFDLAPVRTALEGAGINQPVGVRILQPTGRVLADFGTVKPNKGSWASVPLRAQPRLQGPLGKDGGGRFSVEIRTVAGAARSVQAPICLKPR
jgi:hypothetical protein